MNRIDSGIDIKTAEMFSFRQKGVVNNGHNSQGHVTEYTPFPTSIRDVVAIIDAEMQAKLMASETTTNVAEPIAEVPMQNMVEVSVGGN